MPAIEYACLVEGNQALHIARPTSTLLDENQYVIIFEGGSETDAAVVCVTGDEEFESVVGAMNLAANFLADTRYHQSASFVSGIIAPHGPHENDHALGASLELYNPEVGERDSFLRLTLKFAISDKKTYLWRCCGQGMQGRQLQAIPSNAYQQFKRLENCEARSLILHRTADEARALGRLLRRMDEAAYETVLISTISAWFLPPFLSTKRGPQIISFGECMKASAAHIRTECPGGLAKFWVAAFETIEAPLSAVCEQCSGYFGLYADEVTWKRKCFGCHYGSKPTSYAVERVASLTKMAPWLTNAWNVTADEVL